MGLEAFANGIAFPIIADLTGLKTGLIEAQGELDKTESRFSGFSSSLQKDGLAIGTAMTGAGLAITGLTGISKKVNADLMTTGLQLGVTTEEMQNLALETANIDFPLNEVINTFDLLTRAGMTSTTEIQKTADEFDTLGDALKMPADTVTSTLIPAFNAFKIPLKDAGDHVDGLTYLVRNSTVDLGDFASVCNYLARDLDRLNLSMEDSEAIMLALKDRGIQGSAATRMFRSAVTQADGDVAKLYEVLKITQESVDGYKTKISEADGITKKFADAQNTQYGATAKLKQMWDEWTLTIGSSLEPIGFLGTALATGGPLILGLTQLPSLIGGANAAFTLLAANPIILVISAIVVGLIILEVKFGILTKAAEVLGKGWEWLSGVIGGFIGWLREGTNAIDLAHTALLVLLGPIGWVQLAMDALGISWGDVWNGMIGIAKAGINWLIDGINLMVRGLNLLNFTVPDWVPLIGGKGIGFHLAEIPRLASGGIVTSPTIAMIGERGPEAVVPLSRGSAAGGIVITGNTFHVRDDRDIELIARELCSLIERNNYRGAAE